MELRNKRRVHSPWKRGRPLRRTKDMIRHCREKIRRAKPQLNFSLVAAVKDYNKCFYKYINSRRGAKENLHPLMWEET